MNDGIQAIAGTILQDDQGRFLLVQVSKPDVYGLWNMPAGHADPGETPEETAIRETLEEVGLQVELLDKEPLHLFDASKEKGEKYYAFWARVTGGELAIQEEELLNAKWLTFEEIEALDHDHKIREPWIMESFRKAHTRENSGD